MIAKRYLSLCFVVFKVTVILLILPPSAMKLGFSCDVIVVKGNATSDNSVILCALWQWHDKNPYPIMHADRQTHKPGEMMQLTFRTIPQVATTWAYNYSHPTYGGDKEKSGVPLVAHGINEWGVTIGSTTLTDKLSCRPTGVDLDDLNRVAMERATTALEAVKVIGNLIETYSYAKGKYDCGQLWFIADPNDAWVMECGGGHHWVARRIKEDIFTAGNSATIKNDFDLSSKNIVDFARQKGWCTSRSDFQWAGKFAKRFDQDRSIAIRDYIKNPNLYGRITPETIKTMLGSTSIGLYRGIAKSQTTFIAHLRADVPSVLRAKAWFVSRPPGYNNLFFPLYAVNGLKISPELGPAWDSYRTGKGTCPYWKATHNNLSKLQAEAYTDWAITRSFELETDVLSCLDQKQASKANNVMEAFHDETIVRAKRVYTNGELPAPSLPEVGVSTKISSQKPVPHTVSGKSPRIYVGNPLMDLGVVDIPLKRIKEFAFQIKNIGNAPLKLESMKSSTSWVKPELEHSLLQPGQITSINVSLYPGKWHGPQLENILVESNDPEKKVIALTVSVFLKIGCEFAPKSHTVTKLRAKETRPMEIILVGPSEDASFQVTAAKGESNYITLSKITEEPIKKEYNRNVWRIEFVIQSHNQDFWQDQITVTTTDKEKKHINIPVTVYEEKKFHYQPRMICIKQDLDEEKTSGSIITINSLRSNFDLQCEKIESPTWLALQELIPKSSGLRTLTYQVIPTKYPEKGIFKGQIQIHLQNVTDPLKIPVIVFSQDMNTEQSKEVIQSLIHVLRSASYVHSGRGKAKVKYSMGDSVIWKKVIDFRFKDRLSRSDIYRLDKNQKSNFHVIYSTHRHGALSWDGRLLRVKRGSHPALNRHLKNDLHPETFTRLYLRPIAKKLEVFLRADYIDVNLDNQGILQITFIYRKSKKEMKICFDTRKGYNLLSYSYATIHDIDGDPGEKRDYSYQAEWAQYGESQWYIKKAIKNDDQFDIHSVEILDFQFDSDISDSDFTAQALNIPTGADVLDEDTGKRYKYDPKSN